MKKGKKRIAKAIGSLKLEHKTDKVVPVKKFALRLVKFASFALILILISVAIGTFGYHYIAKLSWLDSFHMACMILTGMGPTNIMETNGAKLFSSFYALYSGIAFLSITAVFFAPVIHRVLHILHLESDEE